ncbi:N-acetyltransferase family protein [Enterococcus olivae]
MSIFIREYQENDLEQMRKIWNQVVDEGVAFPQENQLTLPDAEEFFAEQTFTGVADEEGVIVGLYILHPNNVGRCGHIGNSSYAVDNQQRGKKIGQKLVEASIEQAAKEGFRILQFNAVVATNTGAIHLYQKLGFTQLGPIPEGFRLKDGHYADIYPFYLTLDQAGH